MTPTGRNSVTATRTSRLLVAAAVIVAALLVSALAAGSSQQAATVGCAKTTYPVDGGPLDDGGSNPGPDPEAVTAADFDDDGHLDVASANTSADTVSVFLNDGAGGFGQDGFYPVSLQSQDGSAPSAVVAADFDGDGVIDLATANRGHSIIRVSGTVSVLSGRGDGTFGPPVEYPLREEATDSLNPLTDPGPVDVVAADFDGDDQTDLATVNKESQDVSVLLNNGNGLFGSAIVSPIGQRFLNSLAAADFDGDDAVDLAVARGHGKAVGVLSGKDDGGFASPEWLDMGITGATGVVTADLDEDGHRDVVVSAGAEGVAVRVNAGDGSGFAAPTQFDAGQGFTEDVVAADVTRDDYLDVATANDDDSGEVAVLAGGADATLAPPAMCATADRPDAVAAGDVDGDGTPDLITTSAFDDSMSVLRITGRIAGRVSGDSGDPIGGAELTVTDGEGDQAATTTAGEDGRYAVEGLTAGDYTVSVAPADYQDASAEASVVGSKTATVDFALTPSTGSLAGAVTDADSGDPVGGADLTVTGPGGATAATAEAGSDGGYEIAGLEPATYTVTADHPDYQPASQDVGIAGGQTTTADLALTPATGALAGTATDADTGGPIEAADITVTDADGSQAGSATTGGDGNYEIADLQPASYTVTADHPDYKPTSQDAGVTGGETTTVDFALAPTSDDGGDSDDDGTGDDNDGGDDGGSGDDSDGSGDGGSGDDDSSGDGDGSSGDGDDSSGDGSSGDGSSDGGDSDTSDGGGDSSNDDDSTDGGGGEPAGPAASAAGVSRIAGADRFATAAALSQRAYPDGAEVVYVATGFGFADALTGGVAAAVDQAPLLLVTRSGVPQATAGELDRLAPDRLVILGGRGVIDATVAQTLAGHAGRVDRLAGADRFATAQRVAEAAFPDANAVDTVYVASGHTFADALAGGPAAADAGAPLLLATADGLPAPTRAALDRLALDRVVLLGGPAALGEPVARAASGFADSVDRLAGPTRFATAGAIATDTFPAGADQVLVATGIAFPDALAGGAVAGAAGQPVLLAAPSELTSPTRTAVGELNPASGWLLGGPGALSDQVETELHELLTDNADR